MYTVYYNDSLIYDPRKGDPDYLLIDSKYSGELGKVDSFDFTILPGHPFYDTFDRLQTGIMAYRDGVPIFRGRVLSTSVDLEGEKSVQCEGDLAYLLDSLQPKLKYTAISCETLFRTVIANHNALVEPAKQFTVGEISALAKDDIIDVTESSFNDSRSVLDSHILKSKGGYLRTRYSNGVAYIDWVEDYGRNPDQVIRLGVNLVSYEEEISADDFYTVYFPTGTYPVGDDEEPAEEGQERDRTMTIESVNGGSKYIELTDLVEKYGKIYKAESYDGPDNPTELLADALNDISIYRKRLKRTVEIGALDLHYLDPGIDMLLVGDHVRIISEAHGKDETLVVQKVEFSFTTPEDDKYSFGDGLQTLTSKNAASDSANAAAAAKAGGDSKENSANLKLVKNRIDIEANNMNLTIKENLDITAKVLTTTFNKMTLKSTEFTYHTDEEKARFQTLMKKAEEEEIDVRNQFLMKVEPEIGQAWMEAMTFTQSQWGDMNNVIGMCLDSEQGMFKWDAFRYEYEHLDDTVYDAVERMKHVGIQFDVPDTELKLFAQDEEVKNRLDGQDLVIDENTRRIGLAEITLCGDNDHPGIVSQVGQYIDGSKIINIVNQTPEQYAINAQKIRLYAGGQGDGESLTSYLAAEKGKIELVVMTDENGHWVVNPAAIVASVNGQGQSAVKINADQIDLSGYVTADALELEEFLTGYGITVSELNTTSAFVDDLLNAPGFISTVDEMRVSADLYIGGNCYVGSSIGQGNALKNAIRAIQITQNGNTYTLQKQSFSDGIDWQDVGTFSRATTLARSWSGGEITVTATPQGNVLRCAIFNPTSDELVWNGNKVSFELKANLDGNEVRYPTGKVLEIDAQAIYDAGKRDGSVTTLNGSWSSGKFTVTASPQGNTISTEVSMGPGEWDSNTPNLYRGDIYYSNDGGDNAYPTGATYVVDATSRYNAGYDDGYDAGKIDGSVTTLGGSWDNGTFTVTATPQGNTISVGLFNVPASDVTWNGNTASFPVKANLDGGETAYNTGKTLSIDASSRYNAGYSDGQSDGGLAIDYENGNISATNSNTKVAYIEADVGLSYDSTTHKYTATGMAKVAPSGGDYSNMDSTSTTSGTEAYDSGVSTGYGSARLSLNTANHTINIGNTGDLVSAAVQVSGSVGEYDSTNVSYPVVIKALVNGVEMNTDTIQVVCEPSGAYSNGYNAGDTAGYNRGYPTGYNDNNTAYIEESSQTLAYGASLTVHARYKNYEGVSARSNAENSSITITAPVDRYSTGYNDNNTAYIEEAENNGGAVKTLGYDENYVVHARYKNYEGVSARSNGTYSSYTIKAPTDRYSEGYAAGQSDGGLAIDYENNNISATNSQTKVAYIQAAAGISYDSESHRYTATGKAQVAPSGSDYSDMDTATAVSRTEAYDSGVSDGYGSARLSLNTANHTVNIGNTGGVVTGSVSADAIVGEFDGESMAFPVTVQAKINSTVMAEKLVWVEAFIPEEGGDYQTGYDRGYAAGLAAARLQLITSRGTIAIGTSGNRTEVGVTVSGIVGNWNSTAYRCPVTIKAVVDGVTMATGTVYVYNPNG